MLGIIRLRPQTSEANALRASLNELLVPGDRDGIVSMHLLENDVALSKPIGATASAPGAGDWFVLIDGTEIPAIESAVTSYATALKSAAVSSGVYRLMWDLAKSDISAV